MALLGKLTYIQSYDADDSAYPILGILCDPRAPGYQVPPDLEPHPDTQAWPNHVFYSSTPIASASDGRVMWSYGIFPGPQVPSTRYDPLLGPIQALRRRVVNTGQTASLTATVKTTYDSQNDALIIYELEETNSSGIGTVANPAYPIRIEDTFDSERGAIEKRIQVVTATGSEIASLAVGSTLQTLSINAAGSGYVAGEVITLAGGTIVTAAKVRVLTVSNGVIATFTIDERGLYSNTSGSLTQSSTSGSGTGATFQSATYAIQARQIDFEPIDQFKLNRSIQMWTVPAQLRTADDYDNERGAIRTTLQIIAGSVVTGTLVVANNVVTETTYKPLNSVLLEKKVQTWTVPAPERIADDYDIQRGAIQTTLQIIASSSVAATLTASSNVVTETTYRPLNKELLEKKVQTFAYPGPEIVSEPEIDRDGFVFTIKRQLDLATNITEGETIDGGGLKIVTSEPYSGQDTGPLRYKITKTRALPGTEFTRSEVDGETGAPVSIKMQIIQTPAFPITQTSGSEISCQPISSVHGTKITTQFSGDASSISVVDYPTGSMSAPALITNATLTSMSSRDGTPAVNIIWTKRAAKTREVKMTRTKSYGTQASMLTAQGLLTLENPGVIDIIRDAFFIPAIRESNVLTNAVTLSFTTGTENPKYPYTVESVSWGDTTPTASEYPGRNVVISANVEYWKYNLWRLTKIEAVTF